MDWAAAALRDECRWPKVRETLGETCSVSRIGFLARAVLAGLALSSSPLARANPGGCADYALDLGEEFAIWTQTSAIPVAQAPAQEPPKLALGRKYALAFQPHDTVTFARPPERAPKEAGTFSGIVTFTPTEEGLYRIAISQAAWIDAVQGGKAVATESFEGRQSCNTIRKVVTFRLKAEKAIIQVSGSPKDAAFVMITTGQN